MAAGPPKASALSAVRLSLPVDTGGQSSSRRRACARAGAGGGEEHERRRSDCVYAHRGAAGAVRKARCLTERLV